MGFLHPEYAEVGTKLQVEVIGEPVAATVMDPGLYDPENIRIKG